MKEAVVSLVVSVFDLSLLLCRQEEQFTCHRVAATGRQNPCRDLPINLKHIKLHARVRTIISEYDRN